jgi:hypothetical protein
MNWSSEKAITCCVREMLYRQVPIGPKEDNHHGYSQKRAR